MARARQMPKVTRVFERSRLDFKIRASAYELLVPVVRQKIVNESDQKTKTALGRMSSLRSAAGA